MSMTKEEREAFNRANERVHPVETQWHYPIMTKHGFVPETKEGIGFVRNYVYVHPTLGCRIRCNTGCNADYWRDESKSGGGYWLELEPYLVKLVGEPGRI